MSAIEIYAKIMQVLESSDYEDSSIALEFAQRKINNLRYQNQAMQGATANQLAGYPMPEDYAAKQVAAVRGEIKTIVREVLEEQKSGEAA